MADSQAACVYTLRPKLGAGQLLHLCSGEHGEKEGRDTGHPGRQHRRPPAGRGRGSPVWWSRFLAFFPSTDTDAVNVEAYAHKRGFFVIVFYKL